MSRSGTIMSGRRCSPAAEGHRVLVLFRERRKSAPLLERLPKLRRSASAASYFIDIEACPPGIVVSSSTPARRPTRRQTDGRSSGRHAPTPATCRQPEGRDMADRHQLNLAGQDSASTDMAALAPPSPEVRQGLGMKILVGTRATRAAVRRLRGRSGQAAVLRIVRRDLAAHAARARNARYRHRR